MRTLAASILLLLSGVQIGRAQWIRAEPSGAAGSGPFAILDNRLYACGGNGPIAWTNDAGDTWHSSSNGMPSDDGVISMTSIGHILVAGTVYNGIFYSIDSGVSWLPSKPFPGPPAFYSMTTHDGYVFAGSNGNGMFRSSDSGRDWELDTNGLSSMYWGPSAYSFASYDSLIFAGSMVEEVYRSTNDGNSWQVIRLTPNKGIQDVVQALTVTGRIVFAATNGGLYRSTDLGLTWNQLDTSLFYYHRSPLSLVTANGYLIVGTESNILRSNDNGITWESFNQGWPMSEQALYLFSFESYLFAGNDYNSGIWRRPISDLAGVAEQPSAIDSVTASPNPVSTGAIISFGIGKEAFVTIEVFDVLGNKVTSGFSGMLGAGNHSVPITLAGLPAGIYYARLQTLAGNEMVKLVKE